MNSTQLIPGTGRTGGIARPPTVRLPIPIPSADAFNCPAGSQFACQTLFVNGTLTGDHDWRGLDFAAISGTIDLAGHSLLALAGVDMHHAATVTDTVGGGSFVDFVVGGSVSGGGAAARHFKNVETRLLK